MAKEDKVHVETKGSTFINHHGNTSTEINSSSENVYPKDTFKHSFSLLEDKDNFCNKDVLSISMNPVSHVQSYSPIVSIIPSGNQPCISNQHINSVSQVSYIPETDSSSDSQDMTCNPLTVSSVTDQYRMIGDFSIQEIVKNDKSLNQWNTQEEQENNSIICNSYNLDYQYPKIIQTESHQPYLSLSDEITPDSVQSNKNTELSTDVVTNSSVLLPVLLSYDNPSDICSKQSFTYSKQSLKKTRSKKQERKERGSNFPRTVKIRMNVLFAYIHYHYPLLNTKQVSDVVEGIIRKEYPDIPLTSSFLTYFYTHKNELLKRYPSDIVLAI